MSELLTIDETALALKVTEETVRRLLRAGKLRGFKRGGSWRVPSEALTEPEPAASEKDASETAETILKGLRNSDLSRRNDAIISLSRADESTKNAVLAVVQRETARLPHDDGLDEWRALDIEPFIDERSSV